MQELDKANEAYYPHFASCRFCSLDYTCPIGRHLALELFYLKCRFGMKYVYPNPHQKGQ